TVAGPGRQPQHDRPRLHRAGTRRAGGQPARPGRVRGAAGDRADPAGPRPPAGRAARPLADGGRPPGLLGRGGGPAGRPAGEAVSVERGGPERKGQGAVMADAIRTRRLTKYYGGRKVVEDLSLRVPEGCVYGLLGRNGAGKSTTLKMLVGLVHPDYGHFELLGEDGASLSTQTRGRIAYLAEGHPLYGWMTVAQAVAFTRAFHPAARGPFVEQVLDHFRLSPRARISRLSRGQRAQVSLALALAPDPELLILDDPTLGLDADVRRDFVESMVQVIQRRGRTILFSSHFLGDVERVADRIGVLVDGVLRADCPADHFKTAVRKVVVDFGRPPPAQIGRAHV